MPATETPKTENSQRKRRRVWVIIALVVTIGVAVTFVLVYQFHPLEQQFLTSQGMVSTRQLAEKGLRPTDGQRLEELGQQEVQPLINQATAYTKAKTVPDANDPLRLHYGFTRTDLPDDVRVTCQIDFVAAYRLGNRGKVYTSDVIECYDHDGEEQYSSEDSLVEWTIELDGQGTWQIIDVAAVGGD